MSPCEYLTARSKCTCSSMTLKKGRLRKKRRHGRRQAGTRAKSSFVRLMWIAPCAGFLSKRSVAGMDANNQRYSVAAQFDLGGFPFGRGLGEALLDMRKFAIDLLRAAGLVVSFRVFQFRPSVLFASPRVLGFPFPVYEPTAVAPSFSPERDWRCWASRRFCSLRSIFTAGAIFCSE